MTKIWKYFQLTKSYVKNNKYFILKSTNKTSMFQEKPSATRELCKHLAYQDPDPWSNWILTGNSYRQPATCHTEKWNTKRDFHRGSHYGCVSWLGKESVQKTANETWLSLKSLVRWHPNSWASTGTELSNTVKINIFLATEAVSHHSK